MVAVARSPGARTAAWAQQSLAAWLGQLRPAIVRPLKPLHPPTRMPQTHLLPVFDAALRGSLLALLMLLAALMWRDRPRLPATHAAVALAAGLCVQVVAATPAVEAGLPWFWQAPLIAVSVGNAVLFWVFVQSLFDDDFAWQPVHGVAWVVVLLLSGCNCIAQGPSAAAWLPITLGLQRAVPLLFAGLAVAAAAAHWRSDLVEGRRRLRLFIVLTGSFYTVAMLVIRLGSPQGRMPPLGALLDVALLLVMLAVLAVKLLRVGESALFLTQPAVLPAHPAHPARLANLAGFPHQDPDNPQAGPQAAPPVLAANTPTDPAEERLADALQKAMLIDGAYRSEDLTVASLASRLAVPEYRLRRLINQRLGHRNFNAYVNGFRLDEARAALADPARRELPVLTIALDAGFQSIGPFNRAFKAATGITPTEFRRDKLAVVSATSAAPH